MFEYESAGQADSAGLKTGKFGNKVSKHSVSGLLSSCYFYYATALHFFTTTIITYKTEQHIDNSYNWIAYLLKKRHKGLDA